MRATIKMHVRPSSLGRDREGSVFVRVIHRRQASDFTLSFRLHPSEWDADKQQVKTEHCTRERRVELWRIEKELEEQMSWLHHKARQLNSEGRLSAVELIQRYKQHQQGVLLLPFVKQQSAELRRNGQERTARAYLTACKRLLFFLGYNDLPIAHINSDMMNHFQQWMRDCGRSLNTVSFYMRMLRAIYNKATDARLLDAPGQNPFRDVFTGTEITEKRALSKENMSILIHKWKVDKQNIALSLFVFCFFARGMSFVDLCYLKKTDISGNILRYRRKKTGQLLEMQVTPQMKQIIANFATETKHSPYLFPLIKTPGTNERLQYENALRLQNKRLKGVEKQLIHRSPLCKVKNKEKKKADFQFNFQLSSHVARHTWATIAKTEHLPLAVISEALGHTSQKTTTIYLAAFDRKVLDKANEKIIKALKIAV